MTDRVTELRAYLERELAEERDADGPIILARHDALRIKLTIDFLIDALERMAGARVEDWEWEEDPKGRYEAQRILDILHSTERIAP